MFDFSEPLDKAVTKVQSCAATAHQLDFYQIITSLRTIWFSLNLLPLRQWAEKFSNTRDDISHTISQWLLKHGHDFAYSIYFFCHISNIKWRATILTLFCLISGGVTEELDWDPLYHSFVFSGYHLLSTESSHSIACNTKQTSPAAFLNRIQCVIMMSLRMILRWHTIEYLYPAAPQDWTIHCTVHQNHIGQE